MPQQCREWKEDLIWEQDLVRDFLLERGLQRTGLETDFVKCSDLEREFYHQHPEKRGSERMKSAEFRKLIHRTLGAENFVEEKRVKGIKHHKVWTGWQDPQMMCLLKLNMDNQEQELPTDKIASCS